MLISREEINDHAEKIAEEFRKEKGNIVALTGAGISKASGVPTFRGKEGAFKGLTSEILANPNTFETDPQLVWEWYQYRLRIIMEAEPNQAHTTLVKLEREGFLKAVITQNVDGLHQRAGSKKVIEIHGSIMRAFCVRCLHRIAINEVPTEIPLRCEKCDGLMRPDVVWFGEPLPEKELIESHRLMKEANLVVVIGTSGLVMPAARFPSVAKGFGATIIDINPSITPVSDLAEWAILAPSEEALPIIAENLLS